MPGTYIAPGFSIKAAPLRAIPDPLQPQLTKPTNGPEGWRWHDQRRRRACILAAARKVMTRENFEDVQLRAIARHSGVSVQTIYNLVGNRAELLEASAADWVAAIAAEARAQSARHDLNACFTLLGMFWNAALARPAYVESAVRTSVLEAAPLARPFQQAGMAEFQTDLRRLAALGMVRDGVDVASLARQLTLVAYTTICGWVMERYDLAGYRADLIHGPGMMLAGALQGEELRRLERGMAMA